MAQPRFWLNERSSIAQSLNLNYPLNGVGLGFRQVPGVSIKEYLQAAILPVLATTRATPTRKAHRNHLQCFYDNSRGLQCILRIKQTPLHLSIDAYTEDRVLGICSSTVVPALNDGNDISTQNVPVPPSVTNVSQVAQWVYRIPLMTVQTLFHSENPETSGWRWVGVDKPDPDQSLVKTIHWTNGDPKESPKMIVFVQEPWVLGHKDFTHFTRVKSMPQTPRQLMGKERLWAKIYDECRRDNCRWFILTTYHKWSFGVFSKGFQAVFISLEIPTPRKWAPQVTPLQSIFFWLASCMGLPETYKPEEVMETPGEMQPALHERQINAARVIFDNSDSESCSDSEDEMGKNSTYSNRGLNNTESMLSFQSSNDDQVPIPGVLRNVRSEKENEIWGSRAEKRPSLPKPGDRSIQEHILAPRVYPDAYRKVTATLDWLDHEEADSLDVFSTKRPTLPVVPSSPTQSSSAGLPMDPIGKKMFAVAPQKAVKGKQYKI